MSYRTANWNNPLPPTKPTPKPMSSGRFKYLSSLIPSEQKEGRQERREAGRKPLEPFHPKAMAALPKLKSLGQT